MYPGVQEEISRSGECTTMYPGVQGEISRTALRDHIFERWITFLKILYFFSLEFYSIFAKKERADLK